MKKFAIVCPRKVRVFVTIEETCITADIVDGPRDERGVKLASMGDLYIEIVRFCDYTLDETLQLRENWGNIFRSLRQQA